MAHYYGKKIFISLKRKSTPITAKQPLSMSSFIFHDIKISPGRQHGLFIFESGYDGGCLRTGHIQDSERREFSQVLQHVMERHVM